MDTFSVALSGHFPIGLPSWGRCFWQDKDDGTLFLAYASGDFEVDFVTSADSGVTWSEPKLAFHIDNFSINPNFDIEMDLNGEVHCAFKLNNSGCYAHLTKASGSWFQQGTPVERGWCLAVDSGSVGGFNGSIWCQNVQEFERKATGFPLGFDSTPSVYLIAKCAPTGVSGVVTSGTAIRAARVNPSYTEYPDFSVFINHASDIGGVIEPGFDGGFPVLTDAGPGVFNIAAPLAFRKRQVVYSVDGTGIAVGFADPDFISTPFTWRFDRVMPVIDESIEGTSAAFSGTVTRCPLGPTMTFGHGPLWYHHVHPIWANKFEQGTDEDTNKSWELLSTAHEQFLEEKNWALDNRNEFFRVESRVRYESHGTFFPPTPVIARHSGLDIVQSSTRGIPRNVAPALAPFSGTMVDMAVSDQSGVMKFYFSAPGQDGSNQVLRILCQVQAQQNDENTIQVEAVPTRYSFNFPENAISGVREFAPARKILAGGDGGIAYWKHMKACRQIPGRWGREKKELVATVGSGLGPRINRIVVWDFANSIENKYPFRPPTFSLDHVALSGNNPSFVGLNSATIASSPSDVVNLFDNDTSTSATISNGDSVTLEWTYPVLFTRIEIPWDKTTSGDSNAANFFEVTIETSDDGVTFDTIKTYAGSEGREGGSTGNRLIKISSEYDGTDDGLSFETNLPSAGVGRFLRVSFGGTQTGTRDTRGVRIYGASTTKGKLSTTPDDWDVIFERPQNIGRADPEQFDGVYQFSSLPPLWSASGDWSWFTQASGIYSQPNFLPTAQPVNNGLVQSGVFQGQTIGSGNGSALRTSEWMPLNSSGIVEVDISIGAGEVTENGDSGRTVKWDTRYHKMGVGALGGPEDDEFNFYVVPQGTAAWINAGLVRDWHAQGPAFGGTADYFTVSHDISPGDYTLRWVYKRGNTRNTLPYPGDEAVAYIDNVHGLDGPPTPSIYGYMRGEQFATGVIHGFLDKAKWSAIHGFMDGYFFFQHRHGYLIGGPNTESTIHGYLLPYNSEQINGFLFGGDGLKSIPTGDILGFLGGVPGSSSSIFGWMVNSGDFGSIHGFLPGHTDETGVIYGYTSVADAESYIFGIVNSPSGTASESILGFMANKANEEIYGFVLAPSGTTSSIFGYLSPQNISTIYGFISASGSTTGVINSYLKAPDAGSDIYGYTLSSGDLPDGNLQRIYGYLFSDGASESILGYMNAKAASEILGYMNSVDFASGSINAWTSGIGFGSFTSHGYLAGISGLASGIINGYLLSAEAPSSVIWGTLIGIPDAPDSKAACGGHGTVPLPSVTPAVIPSSCFNI